jgi:hypothetical protein
MAGPSEDPLCGDSIRRKRSSTALHRADLSGSLSLSGSLCGEPERGRCNFAWLLACRRLTGAPALTPVFRLCFVPVLRLYDVCPVVCSQY